jgi:hypothetical protein
MRVSVTRAATSCDAPSPSSPVGLTSMYLAVIAAPYDAPSPSSPVGQARARARKVPPRAVSQKVPSRWHVRGSAPARRGGPPSPRTWPSRFRTWRCARPYSPILLATADARDVAPALARDDDDAPTDRVPCAPPIRSQRCQTRSTTVEGATLAHAYACVNGAFQVLRRIAPSSGQFPLAGACELLTWDGERL